MRKIMLGILFTIGFFLISPLITFAKVEYQNPDTDYVAFVEDDANLLSESEEEQLLIAMQPITLYGNVAFKSINYNNYDSSREYAKEYYLDNFGKNSGTIFLIDMDCRRIQIHSNGLIYRIITSDYANLITDNVYQYATDKEYFTCAEKVFTQIDTLLTGGRISQPMKYICNALFAIILAALINYFLVLKVSRASKPSEKEQVKSIITKCKIANPKVQFVTQSKRLHSSSYSGGHSGGGGGGCGGGGGHGF